MTSTILNTETLQKILKLFSGIVEGIEKATESIKQSTEELHKNQSEDPTLSMPKVVVEKVEFVSLSDLRNLVQANKPEDCDGVAAVIKKGTDKTQVFLTFVKGRKVLDNCINTVIIVSAEAVSKEIKNLFGDNQVIILK
ncbi:MAG: hypothetical protein K2H60_00435 [Muribaculaceae bacterium]|nr:hypothetical protein [Muribaculaceae bacterium]